MHRAGSSRRSSESRLTVRVLWSLLLLASVALAQDFPLQTTFNDWLQHPAIKYTTSPTTDPVAELNRRIAAGEFTLKWQGESGYLKSLLDELKVPLTSQVAVFAKDSFQAKQINSQNPRAIFFNDSVAVGWVRGGFIEIASQDPKQGTVFYTLDSNSDHAAPARSDGCIGCHYNYSTIGVPGMLIRSVTQYNVNPWINAGAAGT